jgi:hypothetical protein
MSAAFALRAALRNRLRDDTILTGILGGARIYDEPPRAEQTPYIVLDRVESRSIAADDTPLEEHRLTLAVWSREAGLAQALRIAARLASVLDNGSLNLGNGYRLVGMTWQTTDSRRVDNRFRQALVRLRAVTELM